MKSLNLIRAAKAANEDRLLDLPGVTGVDVGPKIVKGKKTDELSIRVFVEKKKKSVPAGELIPSEIDGVKTDVIERRFVLHPSRGHALTELKPMNDTATYDPLVGGISIGPCTAVGGFVFTGTLGCLVKDRGTGDMMMLSNYHVMAEKWAPGETLSQPSRGDGGTCPAGAVGSLVRSVLSEKVDGAVAQITARGHSCSIHEIGNVKGKALAAAGMHVRKRGRTTGLTHGKVDSIDFTLKVEYDTGLHTFKHQISIEVDATHSAQFGNHGDSGSVVVDDNSRVVGLYFAGSDDGSFGVANPIDAALDELNVDLCVPQLSIPKPQWRENIPQKYWVREHWKDFFKEVAYDKPPMLEGIDWNWRWLVDPPFSPGRNLPGRPGFDGGFGGLADSGEGIDERLQRLENLIEGGARSADPTEMDVPSSLMSAGQICADFRRLPIGNGPNPRTTARATFHVFNASNVPMPFTSIVGWGGKNGLNAGWRTEIRHSPCSSVSLTVIQWSQPAKVRAFNAAGHVVASAITHLPQGVDQTLTLHGSGIVRVVITAPSDELVIRRYCHCAKHLKEIAKEKIEKPEFKEGKEPWKEKHEIKEIKEFKEKPEHKELAEKPIEVPGFPNNPGDPGPGLPANPGSAFEQRLARLEALLGAQHFISDELRPDLTQGALLHEPDAQC